MNKLICLTLLTFLCKLPATAQIFRHETDNYQIEFPAKPEKSIQKVPSALGEIPMIIFSYQPAEILSDSNYVYMTIESEYPASQIHSDKTEILEKFFRGAIDGAAQNVNGKIIRESAGHFGKYPSRTVEIDFGEGQAMIKLTMILKENKLILIQAIAAPEKYPNKASDQFFSSFRLK